MPSEPNRRPSPSARAVIGGVAVVAVFGLAWVFCARGDDGAKPDTAPAFEPITAEHLHNVHRVTEKVIAGSAPDGEAGLKELADLGVRTIISVDGAAPDAEAARKLGLRYVHLPIGYDDVTDAEGLAIAKAIRDLPGPVYVHCHHGKHRSAAAVAVACVVAGDLSPGEADSVLRTFGTGENYAGLWKSARDARPADRRELDDLKIDFVERAVVPPMAEAMVAIDDTWERLKLAKQSSWRTPADHPDIDPPHEALQLREHLHELERTDDVRRERTEEFRRMLKEGADAAAALQGTLAQWATSGAAKNTAPLADVEAAYRAAGNTCSACHKVYRDR